MIEYAAYGVRIRSDVRIPGAIDRPPFPPAAESDISVTWGSAAIDSPNLALGPYRLAGNRLLFSHPTTGDFLCENGRRIVIDRRATATADDVSASLTATALPAALWMQGQIVLHAAACVPPGADAAWLIVGPSGAGKSAVLHDFVLAGAAVVSDDSVCLRLDGSRVRASGVPACYYRRGAGSTLDAPRQVVMVPEAQQLAEVCVAGLAFLSPGSADGATRLSRLDPPDAFGALLSNRYRPRVPDLLRQSPRLLPTFVQIVERLPMYRLTSGPQSRMSAIAQLVLEVSTHGKRG